MSRILYPRPEKGENGLPVRVGKLTQAEEIEFYRATSGGFAGGYRGSKPNFGAAPPPPGPPRPGPGQQPQGPAATRRGRGRGKAP